MKFLSRLSQINESEESLRGIIDNAVTDAFTTNKLAEKYNLTTAHYVRRDFTPIDILRYP